MVRLETPTALIVDGAMLSSFHLRARLIDAGCNVFARRRQFAFGADGCTPQARRCGVPGILRKVKQHARFALALAELNVPHIFTATGLDEADVCPPFVNHFSKLKELAELRTF